VIQEDRVAIQRWAEKTPKDGGRRKEEMKIPHFGKWAESDKQAKGAWERRVYPNHRQEEESAGNFEKKRSGNVSLP